MPLGSTTGYSQYGFAHVRMPIDDKVGIGILQNKWGIREAQCHELVKLSTERLGEFLSSNQLNIRVELIDKIMPSILKQFDNRIVFVPQM